MSIIHKNRGGHSFRSNHVVILCNLLRHIFHHRKHAGVFLWKLMNKRMLRCYWSYSKRSMSTVTDVERLLSVWSVWSVWWLLIICVMSIIKNYMWRIMQTCAFEHIASDQHVHPLSLIWDSFCLLLCKIVYHWSICGQCRSQFRVCGCEYLIRNYIVRICPKTHFAWHVIFKGY